MLPADLVILAAGVRPDTQFLQSSPLHLNEKGAILVNQKMRTNMPDIYAVGDAVTVEHFIMGQSCYIPLAGPANKQGRIAADNIAGLQSIYTGTQGTSIMKCFDMTAASTGVTAVSYTHLDVYKRQLLPPLQRLHDRRQSLLIRLLTLE